MDLNDKTVAELKDLLRNQGLPISGTKAQLVKRLADSTQEVHVLSLEDEEKV